MLYELFLALQGNHGGIFKHDGENIKVEPNLPFMCAVEKEECNKLCRIGMYYKKLGAFIQRFSSGCLSHDMKHGEWLHGIYLQCFCQGLSSVLDDYHSVLIQLERDFMSDPHLPVSFIASKLHQFEMLFPSLMAVIDRIITHKAHGCYILDILHKESKTGDPIVENAIIRILHSCHKPLYQQLNDWLIHGLCIDPYKEFFIQQSGHNESQQKQEEAENDEDDLGIMGVTGRQLQRIQLSDEAEDTREKEGQFHIAADLLPSYIPMRVANKILFIGESVLMFERNKHSQNSKLQVKETNTIMTKKEQEFSKDLYQLSTLPEFDLTGFELVINKIRAHVAEFLWVLVVEEYQILRELRIMKDFYLLGRGELYLAFIDNAQHLLLTPPSQATQHDVNLAFQQAARNVLISDEDMLQRFRLTVPPSSKNKKDTEVETGWDVLSLSYGVQWPLHIFFTPAIFEKYNKLLSFLLSVRRVQLDLQHCWGLMMFNKSKFISPSSSITWQLRTHMAFLIDNLQYYLQVDVIESQFKLLIDKINSTKDFEAVKLAHEQFLSSLLAQSFVHMRLVSKCLHEIQKLCSQFCRIVHSSVQESSIEVRERELEQLIEHKKKFRALSHQLFEILSNIRLQSSRPYLAQLLLRLDYNKYFSTTLGEIETS